MNQIEIKELLNLGKSREGAWSKAQLEALGISWPPLKGWKLRLNNTTEDQARNFLALKDEHLPKQNEDMETYFTNWGDIQSTYSGELSPWEFPTFIGCEEK